MEGGAKIEFYTEMEGGARITWSVCGMKKDDVEDMDKADYTEFIQNELAKLLENDLTDKLREDISNGKRDHEILMTKYNTTHLEQCDLQDDIDNFQKREASLEKQKKNLVKNMEEMSAENEDLIAQLNAAQSSAASEKMIASLKRENNKLQKQHDAEIENAEHLEEEVEEWKQKYESLAAEAGNAAEEHDHSTLLNQQKEIMGSRIKDLEAEIQAMKRNFMAATKAKEDAIQAKRDMEGQFATMKAENSKSVDARMKARNKINALKDEINELQDENASLQAGATKHQGELARGNMGQGDKDRQIDLLQHQLVEQKTELQEIIDRKDIMLNEIKDALKSLGLKLGNLDSKMAIPKLKALLSILTKQVQEYKGRQRELEHLVKARTNELQYYKDHFGDRNSHRSSVVKKA